MSTPVTKQVALAATALSLSAALAPAAEAKTLCGWYAIAYCSENRGAVVQFANNGWGAVINTNHFSGFAPGRFCAVSGPQSKSSAVLDRRNAIGNGVADDVYIKRACADEYYTGD